MKCQYNKLTYYLKQKFGERKISENMYQMLQVIIYKYSVDKKN